MKFKFVATARDIKIFAIFAIFLLYIVALGVVNIPVLSSTGKFYGLNPIEAFLPDKLPATLILYFIALLGLFLSVKSYFFEFESGVGFKIGDGNTGGYSDWSKPKDIKNDTNIKKVVASDPKSEYAGVPLISNGKELWVDNGEYHTLVMGATGSGKTQDTILPTIKVLAKKGESVVVTDPKGEIFEKAGGLLKEKGYNILLLNFRNPQNGNTWNPLELPYRLYKEGNQDKAIELLDDLALNILYDETNANSDPFWEKTAADYFSGIALAMFEDTTEDKININSINMTATVGEDKFGGSTYIKEYFNTKDPSSAAYVNASGTVMAPSETKGGIISVFKQKVKLFASRENLSEMLSYSDFKLDSIGTQPTAVFIIIQDEKKTYHSLATIFIKQVYETLIDVAQAHGGKLPCRTNFLLDEFANMPPLKDVTTMITAARSRQIRFTMIIQNFAQLNKVYGKDDAETIKGNCGNIIYLISTELAALEEISKLCGEKKSKKDDKTASTPLVTVSDLQRMKQFDHILLRMRKSPFKTSFVPDFKIDWGKEKSPKIDYPVREKRPVAIFDIREFVKEKKNQKINEMMASIGGGSSSPSSETSGGAKPTILGSSFNGEKPVQTSSSFGDAPKKQPEISVNDLVKKIDEKLAEIEREEQEAKNKKQAAKAKQEAAVIEEVKTTEPKIEKETKPPVQNVVNNVTINNYGKDDELEKGKSVGKGYSYTDQIDLSDYKPKKYEEEEFYVPEPGRDELDEFDDDLISKDPSKDLYQAYDANKNTSYDDVYESKKVPAYSDVYESKRTPTFGGEIYESKKTPSYEEEVYNRLANHQRPKTISEYNKRDNVELLDEDLILSNEEIERKVNEKLSSDLIEKETNIVENKADEINKRLEIEANNQINQIENQVPVVKQELPTELSEQEQVIRTMQEGFNELNNNNNSYAQQNTSYEQQKMAQSGFKPTSTIKLEDKDVEEKFFDDFFDD